MKILAEAPYPGYPKLAKYLVEKEPERRLIFFRRGIDSAGTMGEPLDIPIPRSLYVVQAPAFKNGKITTNAKTHSGATTHHYAIDNDGEEVTDKTPVYLLPWPNYYMPGSFSLCNHGQIKIPDGASREEIVEDTMIHSWNITFGYLSYPTPPAQWITSAKSIHSGIKKPYEKWEKLTLEEACDMPWGRYPPNPSGRSFNTPATKPAAVADIKKMLGI
jgi:hypothetical protein